MKIGLRYIDGVPYAITETGEPVEGVRAVAVNSPMNDFVVVTLELVAFGPDGQTLVQESGQYLRLEAEYLQRRGEGSGA